jgi:serine/threonine-protein kinase
LSPEDIQAQLGRILSSAGFVSSQRLCRFLRFVVERTLENDVDRLKEYAVALEVFDRKETYDPTIDSIVRVEARRLRWKLKAYYEGQGTHDPILIGLQPGSYAPVFRELAPPPTEEAALEDVT